MIALTVAAADAGVPRRHDAWQTLTGTCTKVTVMDVSADPTVCSDQVATIKFSDGMLGFAFTIRPPGTVKPWVMSFFATRSSRSGAGSDKNAESLSIHRVYFTIGDKTDDLDATWFVRPFQAIQKRFCQIHVHSHDEQRRFRWRVHQRPHVVGGMTTITDGPLSCLFAVILAPIAVSVGSSRLSLRETALCWSPLTDRVGCGRSCVASRKSH